jgi:hypothetical protein
MKYLSKESLKHLSDVRKAITPRSSLLLAVVVFGSGFAAAAYRRRRKDAVATAGRE